MAVLVIASRLHTARVQRNVSAVDDNVAVAEGVLAAFHFSASGGVTLYLRIPKRPLVNSMDLPLGDNWMDYVGIIGEIIVKDFPKVGRYNTVVGYILITLSLFFVRRFS